jgi:hypothetical protein
MMMTTAVVMLVAMIPLAQQSQSHQQAHIHSNVYLRSVPYPFAFLVATAMLPTPASSLILLPKFAHGATTGTPRLKNLVSAKMGSL